ncbi:hypothetical protein BHYA_0082g00130 [Botrytis hyacinthi]|uniref:Uncharacterized protein n=1 Tax=Botrytis hyacinthi TaxID=278943 RepID=A0A4Z1GS87_9HELO|nr:hypothetical protein BHYA_0082g00130 [Botrytis hyacinthi]
MSRPYKLFQRSSFLRTSYSKGRPCLPFPLGICIVTSLLELEDQYANTEKKSHMSLLHHQSLFIRLDLPEALGNQNLSLLSSTSAIPDVTEDSSSVPAAICVDEA